MRWRGRRQSSNVEDRRGGNPGSEPTGRNPFGRGGRLRMPGGGNGVRRASSGGIGGIVIMVVLYFGLKAFGIDLLQVFTGGNDAVRTSTQQSAPPPQNNSPVQRRAGNRTDDELGQFAGVILAETEDVWRGIFETNGQTYPEPKLVLFTDSVRSACGNASSASGPFYCPGDSKLYIDLSFFGELDRKFGASGDFAQAYVLAHEVGHHVQNVIGVLPKFNEMRRTMSKTEANQMSVRVELQADCFAGIWGYYTNEKGLLERGDLEEALNAAAQIGDDTIQRRTQGYVVPESFSHGTSDQRKYWFSRGFESGRLDQCDTFNAESL